MFVTFFSGEIALVAVQLRFSIRAQTGAQDEMGYQSQKQWIANDLYNVVYWHYLFFERIYHYTNQAE
jgi:hypothetical protein